MNQQLKSHPRTGGVRGIREKAIADGLTLFNTGRPCKRGHLADRYTSTGNCVECHALRNQVTAPQPSRAPFVPREGVVVLRSVAVPRKHLHVIRQLIDAYMAAEGLLPGPPPLAVPESNSRPVRRKQKPS